MRLLPILAAVAALLHSSLGSSTPEKKPAKPCTIRSPNTDRFFDLNPLHVVLPDPSKKLTRDNRNSSWHAPGYDYGSNFTINFCGPVVEELKAVEGLDKDLWKNVSAYYEQNGKTYAIGLQNSEPIFRGRKLVLNYTDGSLCSSSKSKQRDIRWNDDDSDETPRSNKESEDSDKKKPDVRRKSSIFSLLCETDPLNTTPTVAFLSSSPDECTYFFEVRTPVACGGIEKDIQTLGPSGVFGVIALIAILVYLAGGCVYQRTVMHQRGWRQLPNYTLWAGVWGFIKDMFIIVTSSCLRAIPKKKGYSRAPYQGHSRGRNSDDENRLIDQLDEEWDD